MIATIKKLHAYHHWAMEKIFYELENFSEEEFTRDLGEGTSSVRDKICHIIAADTIWLDRIEGLETKFMDSSFFPSIQTTKKYFLEAKTRFEKILTGLNEANSYRKISFKNKKGDLIEFQINEILLHVVNHGTYHRGQLASLIRRIKGKPPTTDLIEFFKNV